MCSTGRSAAKRQANRAASEERSRQAGIVEATGRINALFDDPKRTAQYGQLAKDTTDFLVGDLDRQKVVADRNTRFAMARSGQTGGSVAVDANRDLGENYLRGVVEATRRGNAAAADLRGADEQSRANLLALAQSGVDATTAGARADGLLASNLAASRGSALANGMSGFYADFADLWRKSQDAAAMRKGQKYGYDTIYGKG